ncbi:MAG TPA: hypothetical protein VF073_02670, partial [Gaiella sp.]
RMRGRARVLTTIATAAIVGLAATGAGAAAGPVPPVLNGAPGIAVAGGAHVVAVAKQGGGATQLRLVRDRDRAVLRTRVLPANLGVPMVTFSGLVEGTWAKGRRLVLASSVYDDQVNTRFVVIDTRTLAPLRTIRLAGTYAFDAVSSDGRRLFVLQYPGGVQGGVRYVVRSVDLRTGKLEPGAIVDKTEPSERMSGIALARAWSRDGAWVYTLYNGGTSHAFVHALNTRTRVARCIDLPWAGNAQSVLDGVLLAVTPSRVLTLTGRGGVALARIDTRTFSVQA